MITEHSFSFAYALTVWEYLDSVIILQGMWNDLSNRKTETWVKEEK